jgi:hypothetical protein
VSAISRLVFSIVANPFRKPKAEIKKSEKANGAHHGAHVTSARKVGLKPKQGWQKRNFLTEVLIPSLFEPRSGEHVEPKFPELKQDEIGLTWIGHASFLIQTR